MDGTAPAASGSGGGGGGRSAAGSGPAAAWHRTASGNGAAAEGFVVTFSRYFPVPAAARPWFLVHGSDGERVPVTVYGRRPDGSLKPHSATLHAGQQRGWWLGGVFPLLNDLDVHKGDRVRMTREQIAAAGRGAAAEACVTGVVVEKVAGQQQQGQHRRRHVRTAVHIDPPLDPAGPSAGRVVTAKDRRFVDSSKIQLTRNVVLCLMGETRIDEARAAAANGDTTPKYLVTVYARRETEDGPPTPFQDVALTPSPRTSSRANRCGSLNWFLTGLNPLRQHLGLAPSSPVRLVREVGQDGRVRLVVEPRGKGDGGGKAEGKGKGKGEGERQAERVEDGDPKAEDDEGSGTGGSRSEGSEPGSSDDDDEGSTSSDGEGSGGGDSDLTPGGGGRPGSRGAKRLQVKHPQPQPPQPQLQQQPQPPPPPGPPPQEASQPAPQPHQQQQPHPQDAHPHQAQALPPTWQLQRAQPQIQVPQTRQQQPQPGLGGGGGGGGPAGAAVPGAGGAGEGPGGGEQGRPGKRRRPEEPLELRAELPAVGQDGPSGSSGGPHPVPQQAAPVDAGEAVDAGEVVEAMDPEEALVRRGIDLLAEHLEGSRAALAAAEARAAALQGEKATLERQLGRESARAEAAEGRFRRVREHLASVLRRLGLPVEGAAGLNQQQQQQALIDVGGGGEGSGGGAGPSGAEGPGAGWAGDKGPGGAGERGQLGKRRRQLMIGADQGRSAGQHGGLVDAATRPVSHASMDADEQRMRFHTDRLAAHAESSRAAVGQAEARAAALQAELVTLEGQLEPARERAEAAEGRFRRAQEHLAGVLWRLGLSVEGAAGQPPPPQQQPPSQPRTPAQRP